MVLIVRFYLIQEQVSHLCLKLLFKPSIITFFTLVCVKDKNNLVDNDQCVDVLFIIPITINFQRLRFEVYTLVSEIHDNEGMVMGIKNLYEVEGAVSTGNLCLHFMNRYIVAKTDVFLKPREQRFMNN